MTKSYATTVPTCSLPPTHTQEVIKKIVFPKLPKNAKEALHKIKKRSHAHNSSYDKQA